MIRLSSPIAMISSDYDVVVIGSGYGGGVAASRLARTGKKVCVLERGRELQPGEYPDEELEAVEEFQVDLPGKHIGSRTALFDFRNNKEINVMLGCGLGGTSLINANVSLRADPRVFTAEDWPQEIIEDVPTGIEAGYREAKRMLRPVTYPDDFPKLRKLEAHRKSSQLAPGDFSLTPINVNFETFPNNLNHVGVEQRPCILCGDCVSGCNHRAKNTTLMNYLPDAWNHGAEIYTQLSVQYLERHENRWRVHYQILETGREAFDAPMLFVMADVVVLGAGSLGTTEILLRSKRKDLALSDQLGQGFTGNGDVLGFGYNNDEPINGIGFGHVAADADPEDREPVGPCITSVIDSRSADTLEDGMVIEEGSIPGAVSAMLPMTLGAAASLVGRDTDTGIADHVRETARHLESFVRGAYHGATRNTQTFLVMAHDDAGGVMKLEDDRLRIHWPGVGEQGIFKRADDGLYNATKALGGTYVKNPTWTKLFGQDLVTVHPLGGAGMAVDATKGVVNHKGQVYKGSTGTDVYDDLYVVDGAMMPRSLGVNPLLTICAFAERNCKLLAEDRGWSFDYALPSSPRREHTPVKPGIRFTETMEGDFSTEAVDSYENAAAHGQASGSSFKFTLTIASSDVETMLEDPAHEAIMVGTVEAAALSSDPLTTSEGKFNLFVKDPEHIGVRRMIYRMRLHATDGATYYFKGFKTIRDDAGLDVWDDTTTLYITVHKGKDDSGSVLGRGILKIHPNDLRRQLTTMTVTGVDDRIERLRWLARFGRFFSDTLFQTYGGLLARDTVFDPDAPPRKTRPLRVDAPEFHPFRTRDGVDLRLTRYRGGDKGPVVLSHGLGVSSRIFSTDTIQTNLLEYLFTHGYDVWLLDYRSSIELPASISQHTADDIATQDYPAAVAKVLEATGKNDLQMVAHCFGSTTFFMAMLAGLEGVRSAVASQIATYIEAPFATRLKSGLHVAKQLERFGIDSLDAYVDSDASWVERLYDQALRLFPQEREERCHSRTCRRISFMYSLLYEHDQLNRATHESLHEMFGVANIASLQHLALLVRRRHLVDARGEEVYMPHLERLAIPIRFIHGSENACFRPVSTQRTYDELRSRNGRQLYSRFEIPNYGHIDCIFGHNAVHDVYPKILEHLEAT